MKRPVIPLAFIAATALAEPSQAPWNHAGTEAWRKELESREKAAAIFPLSPNVILGRARYGDAKNHIAVLLLDRDPGDPGATLVARDADCTPRAVLVPMRAPAGSPTVVCYVSHGAVTPGMEIVLPGKALLERGMKSLPEHPAPPRAAAPAPGPGANAGR